MNNTKCSKCTYNGYCDSKKKFKAMKKKCKKLKKKYKGINIEISCRESMDYIDSLFYDPFGDDPFSDCSFDNNLDTNTDDADTENSDSNNSSLDTQDNISKSLSELELLNKNIESLINLLQNKLKQD